MENKETIVKSKTKENKTEAKAFAFDFSYWSFDGYKTEADGYLSPLEDSNYCDQKRLFNDLGMSILLNSFLGYNSSLFAYGQTGSGKNINYFKSYFI
jgi:hypothetical protein